MAKEKKKQQPSQPTSIAGNRWGVELRPELHVRRRVLSLHLLRVSSRPPSKVSDEYSGKY